MVVPTEGTQRLTSRLYVLRQYLNSQMSLSNSPPSRMYLSYSPTTFPNSPSLSAVFVPPPRGDDEGPGTRRSRDQGPQGSASSRTTPV